MPILSDGSVRRQFEFMKYQFLQGGDLPFSNVLTSDLITKALEEIEGR